jgi:hypothetical protein
MLNPSGVTPTPTELENIVDSFCYNYITPLGFWKYDLFFENVENEKLIWRRGVREG